MEESVGAGRHRPWGIQGTAVLGVGEQIDTPMSEGTYVVEYDLLQWLCR